MQIEFLQTYWWLLVSILGAILVFLLFVQGGQTMIRSVSDERQRNLLVNSLGRKWEFTFTTLVVFGGAFFASFPLFYSTSFGGAYWLWMLILISFVLQAVSYEFRRKKGNLYTTATYDFFLAFNGFFGCVMLGVAVGTMFFGGEFVVVKGNIVDMQSPVISQWAPTHGLEAMGNGRCLLLGLAVFFLARTLASLYFVNNIAGDEALTKRMRRATLINGIIFALLFVAFLVALMIQPGLKETADGFQRVENLYFHNLLSMWWIAAMLVAAVVLVLYGIFRTAFSTTFSKGIWYSGIGTILAVLVLFFLAGFGGTAYLPSTLDPDSSLTIANSSASQFTLTTMFYVSFVVPVVIAYIAVVWRKMNATPLTSEELKEDSHQY